MGAETGVPLGTHRQLVCRGLIILGCVLRKGPEQPVKRCSRCYTIKIGPLAQHDQTVGGDT
jgi:hypothetical protein